MAAGTGAEVLLGGGAGGEGSGSGEGGEGGELEPDLLGGGEGQGGEGGEGGEGGGETEYELDEAGEPKLDAQGNKVPKQAAGGAPDLKTAFNKLKEVDPAAYKAVRAQYGENIEYKKVFPTVQAAREASE